MVPRSKAPRLRRRASRLRALRLRAAWPGPAAGPGPWPGASSGSMLLLSLLTLLVAGGTSYGILRSQVAARIDDALSRTVSEFRVLSASSVDPATGAPFVRAEDLVYVAMQRTLPAANEGMMALGPTDVRWVAPESVVLRPEADRQLLDGLLSEAAEERVVLRTLSTGTTTYRLAVVPVQLADDAAPMRYVVTFDLSAELAALGRTHLVFLAAGLAALALSAVLGWMLVARLLAPLRELRRTAEAISEHDLGQRLEVRGNDDLADLSTTFNHMLDRLGNALRSQRQLLDDVGHELRTPITIVQGHLELQDATDPHDVEQTRGIALDELDRMSLLVDDLVMLAKADRSDFVAPVPVEMDVLIDDVLEKARGLGDRRWIVERRAHGTAELDPRRIEQAMLQLCQNAVKFSGAGSTVALGCGLHAGTGAPLGARRGHRRPTRRPGCHLRPLRPRQQRTPRRGLRAGADHCARDRRRARRHGRRPVAARRRFDVLHRPTAARVRTRAGRNPPHRQQGGP